MEIAPSFYYDSSKFSNTHYLVQMEIEKYFANNMFKGNLTRVFYSSEEYAFRQRMNYLAQLNQPVAKELQFPFMSYFRNNNWEFSSDYPGVQGTSSMFSGVYDEQLNIYLRWLQTKINFTCVAWFQTDKDAQMAHETLLWIKHPGPKVWAAGGLEYKGRSIDIPIQMFVDQIQFNPSYTEVEWLKKNRIFPIKFFLTIRSAILSQLPQGPESTLFPEDEAAVITEKVILDFFAYKFNNPYWNEDHTALEVSASFNPDLSLNGSLTVDESTVTNTSFEIDWNYNSVIDQEFLDPPPEPLPEPPGGPYNTIPNPDYESYETNIKLVLNGFTEIDVPMINRTYTFTNLQRESLYNITIWFFKKTGEVTKYVDSVTTTTQNNVNLKGMIGYKY